MSVSIRVKNLKIHGLSDSLDRAEKHGKRLDVSSQLNRVREVEPLVYGTLDLVQAYERHIQGCRMNASLRTPVQHAILKFPSNIRISGSYEEFMLKAAVKFINRTFGGRAVFAARLDRDEEGQHNVDVFFCPKYKKVKKDGTSEWWISSTRHGKLLCEKHRVELMSRHREGEFRTSPRQVGIALNSEFRLFMEGLGFDLEPKMWKVNGTKDWVSADRYKLQKENANLAEQVEKYKRLVLALGERIRYVEANQNASIDSEMSLFIAEQSKHIYDPDAPTV